MRGFTAAEMEKLLAKVGLATLIARYSDVILRLAKGRAGAHRCEFRGNPAGDSDLMSATVPI